MAAKMDGITPPFIPIGGINGLPTQKPKIPVKGAPFHDILKRVLNETEKIRFSAHARSRLTSRNIQMDEQRLNKLVNAVEQAQAKGVHDSLILMDNLAFIVNIDNRTVVTAMDSESLTENIFTNIDSAIVVK